MTDAPFVSPQRLIDFVGAVFASLDVPERDAHLVADSLVQADLWGHQSHGVLRLSWYAKRIQSGVMKAKTAPEFVVDSGALAVIDGHDGIGQVLTAMATRDAVRRAKAHGVAVVALRNSNHFGTAMYYTLIAAREGCVAFLSTNASPAMAPWGGRSKTVGTNPWSIAAPAGRYAPMVLDIANTGVARGKIYLAKQKGLPIPLGWAINTTGEPTTDATEAIDGIILPMAGHKGYGIAMMMDVMSGVLTGSEFGKKVNGPYQFDQRSGCGQLMIVLDISAFQSLDGFNTRMEELIQENKSVPLAKGFEEIFYPGEMEARSDEENRRRGLELPRGTLEDLRTIAKTTGLQSLLPF